jgi:hypothetical protein
MSRFLGKGPKFVQEFLPKTAYWWQVGNRNKTLWIMCAGFVLFALPVPAQEFTIVYAEGEYELYTGGRWRDAFAGDSVASAARR